MGLVGDCDVEVTFHICWSSKASWDAIPQNGVHFENMPEDLEAFIHNLQHQDT